MTERVVVLTGSEGGIGTAIKRALYTEGHTVVGIDKALMANIVADLSKVEECRDAIRRIVRRHGRIDCLINNAAIGSCAIKPDGETNHPRIDEITAAAWDKFFAINVRAPMLMVQECVPHMKGWGRVINVTTSYRTMMRLLPYGATKAALEASSAVWAKELTGTGITCNVLVPGGPVDTAFIAKECDWPRDQMYKAEIMGPPAAWLVSSESDMYTGQRFTAADWKGADKIYTAYRPIGWPELAQPARAWQRHNVNGGVPEWRKDTGSPVSMSMT